MRKKEIGEKDPGFKSRILISHWSVSLCSFIAWYFNELGHVPRWDGWLFQRMWFAFRLIAQLTLELLWPTVSCLIELFRFGLSGRGRKHYQRLSFTAWKLMGSSLSTISCVFQSLYIKVRDIQPNSRQWVSQENACHLGPCCIILLHPFFPFLFPHWPENHRL